MVRSLSLSVSSSLSPCPRLLPRRSLAAVRAHRAIVLVLGRYCTHLLPRILRYLGSFSPWQYGTLC